MRSFIELQDIRKVYKVGDVEINAVDGVSFSINKGEFAIVAGASGAGKSTVLNILGGMDTVTSGKFFVDNNEINEYNSLKLTTYRRNEIGFVFQFYNLVQNLNALENVELATEICKNSFDPKEILKQVGLEDRLYNFPSQLSGGEQQRVAIARALAKNPKILLCDEPTGALDYNTGRAILQLLQETCIKTGMTVIVITHNQAIAPMGNKLIKMKNGKIQSITENDNPEPVERIEW